MRWFKIDRNILEERARRADGRAAAAAAAAEAKQLRWKSPNGPEKMNTTSPNAKTARTDLLTFRILTSDRAFVLRTTKLWWFGSFSVSKRSGDINDSFYDSFYLHGSSLYCNNSHFCITFASIIFTL